MKIDTTIAAKSGEAKETRAEKAIRLLTTAVGDPFKLKLKEFEPFYAPVCIAQSNGLPRKQILKYLEDAGLKLYPSLFEKLMEEMGLHADRLMCAQCGQLLSLTTAPSEESDTAKNTRTDGRSSDMRNEASPPPSNDRKE